MPYTPDIQKRNAEMIGILSADFQRRYEANFHFGQACAMYQALPGLRGFWPCSSFDAQGNLIDLSGQGRTLTYAGTPDFYSSAYRPLPIVHFDGTNDYFYRPDEPGLSITGTESVVNAVHKGLTFGCWVYWGATMPSDAGFDKGVIGKYYSSANLRSYMIYGDNPTDRYNFSISDDGTNVDGVGSGSALADINQGEFQFVVARFDPSTEIKLWVSDGSVLNTITDSTTYAEIDDNTSQFNIAAFDNGTASTRANILVSMAFVCCMALPDFYMFTLFHYTRAMFGV